MGMQPVHQEEDISYKRRYILVRTSLVIVSVIGSLFSVINYQRGLYVLATTELVVFAACLLLLYMLKKRRNLNVVSLSFVLICCALGLIAARDPRAHPTVVVWIALGPLIALFLLGKRLGSVISVAFCAGATGLYLWNHASGPQALPLVAISNIVIFLASVLTLSYYFESTRAVTESTLTNDIAERKRIEETLKESEERFRRLADSTFEGIVIHDEGEILDVNQSILKMFGFEREEVVGHGIVDFIAPESLETVSRNIRTGFDEPHEIIMPRKDGVKLTIEVRGGSITYKGIVARVVTLRDITEQKKAQEELRKSEQKYRDIVMNSIGDAYYECDLKGRITFINKAGLEMMGYTLEELTGRDYRQYSSEKTFKEVFRAFNEVYRTGVPDLIKGRELILKDGSTKLVDNSVSLVKDADERPVGFRGILRDVTEQKRAEENLQILNEELQSTYRELEDFSFSVSHDLRTPLRAIDGFSAILDDKFKDMLPVEAQRYIGIVRLNAQKMGVLLDGMRDFLSINRKTLKKTPVAPVDIIRGVIAYLKPMQENRQIEIVVGDLPTCLADPEMLKLVFSHLLSNALKFTAKCDIARIELGFRQDEGETIYFVKDNGIGFDMRYVEKVFSVYQRLHSQDEFEGIGLGLAMVKHIINHHGGRIWVESEPGRGTTLFFTVERRLRG